MARPLRANAGELAVDVIMEAIKAGRRVVITTTTLDEECEVTLRYADGRYYCDTPTRLHRHETESEMRTCIRKNGYGWTEPEHDGRDDGR